MKPPGSIASAPEKSDAWRKRHLATRLRALMTERGLTVAETARLIRERLDGDTFNLVNISHYRAGRSLPRPRVLKALSEVFGVEPTDLVPEAAAEPEASTMLDDGLNELAIKVDAATFADLVSKGRMPDELPPFNLVDLPNGEAWLQINQRMPWSTVLKIIQILKGVSVTED